MNQELITAGLKVFLASLEFMRQIKNDDAALQAIVEQARTEGREIDLADVKGAVQRMHDEGDSLRELIAAKKAGD